MTNASVKSGADADVRHIAQASRGRRYLRYPIIVIACLLSFPLLAVRLVSFYTGERPDLVEAVLRAVPLTDGHNDFPMWIRDFYRNHIYNFTETSRLDGHVDFPRLRRGGLRAQFWSIYVPCPAIEGDYSDEVYHEIVHDTLQQIDLLNRLIAFFPDRLQHAASAGDVWDIFTHSDRIASLMGAEGLHQIGNSASILRIYHRLGVRYVTLTHECHNRYADSCSPATPLHHGLSKAGISLLKEMNRMGMIIDLSHTSPETMRAALNVTKAPVMFSHSSSFTISPHPRNVPDDVLLAVKENGGVVMVTFHTVFTNCRDPTKASLADVADHIEHIGNLIGYQHVGIGADFDGMPTGVKGLEDVSKYPDLIRELSRRGMSPAELEGVMGRNALRVLEEVELTAAQMRDQLPLEDEVKSLSGPNYPTT